VVDTMKAIVWNGGKWPAGLEFKDFPKPELRAGWVLVKNQASGICGSDLHYLGGQTRHLIPDTNLPAVLGHENAGIIVEIGDNVAGLKPGDRVAMEPLHGCHEMGRNPPCAACQAGHYELCEHLTHVGIPLVEMLPGGYGQYSIVHASKAYKMPDTVSFEDAALLDVLAVGVHALGIGKPIPGMAIAVLGSGVIGIDIIQCLRAWGVSTIIATAKYPFQAEAARKAGASNVILLKAEIDPVGEVLRLTGGHGVDQVYEGVGGKTDVMNEAIRMCRSGGTVIMTGIFDGERPIDLLTMLFHSVSILTSNSYSITGLKPDYQIALDLLATGQITHDFVVTHRFSLEEYQSAINTAFDKKNSACLRAMFIHNA